MSLCRDDYAPTNENPTQFEDSNNSEPADPDIPDHSARRGLPLAPDSVKLNRLPEPFVTDKGEVMSVAEAGETYLKVQRSNWNDNALTSKYERHRFKLYPQILEADRHFRMKYDDVTTAMVTRRLSPLDSSDRWLTPWECNEMLHGGTVHRSVRNALDYELGTLEYEWLAVTAPTRSAGTPHEHIYLWIDDPDNEVTTDTLRSALDKHIKHCTNAHEKHHRYRTDGTSGAITVQHDPALIDTVPDEFFNITENSQTYAETGRVLHNTRGAQYLASQLAHLPIGDLYAEDRDNPEEALFEGAALAWASPYNWFRTSGGVPA